MFEWLKMALGKGGVLRHKEAVVNKDGIVTPEDSTLQFYDDCFQIRTDDHGLVFLCDKNGNTVPQQTGIAVMNTMGDINYAVVGLHVKISNLPPIKSKKTSDIVTP